MQNTAYFIQYIELYMHKELEFEIFGLLHSIGMERCGGVVSVCLSFHVHI
jgi:hypothetical protein